MKKLLNFLLCFVLLLNCIFIGNITQVEAVRIEPTRIINVVYDDSGSMFRNADGENVQDNDRWCNAKYSLEVLVSLLSKNDTMNIYFMSDYATQGAHIVLSGADDTTENVKKVHETTTNEGATPFGSVKTALTDLSYASADEKWLLIMTDGQFDNTTSEQVAETLEAKPDDINVMLLAMGNDAIETANALQGLEDSKHIYTAVAQSSSEILNQITDISTRLYNSNKLDNQNSQDISFDVPMSELKVFAQGQNVNITSITDSYGNTYYPDSIVEVKYNTAAEHEAIITNEQYKYDPNLVGKVATFNGDYLGGDYTINVTGADNGITVFYKTNVSVNVYLYDEDGNEVTDKTNLKAGNYTIKFGFVKEGTNEKVGDSELLGNVKFNASITLNGEVIQSEVQNGQQIELTEGDLVIDATGSFLDYNKIESQLQYVVLADKAASFEVINDPIYKITNDTKQLSTESNPIKIKVTLEGKEVTEEQWKTMELPTVTLVGSSQSKIGSFLGLQNYVDSVRIEKSDEIGIYNLYPSIDSIESGRYTNTEYEIDYEQAIYDTKWSGKYQETIKIKDNRGFMIQFKKSLIRALLLILFFLFILLLINKRKLPDDLRNHPFIQAYPNYDVGKPTQARGLVRKRNTRSLYKVETATIRYTPNGVVEAPPIMVKASAGNVMIVTNYKDFINNEKVLFNGQVMRNDVQFAITPKTVITYKDKYFTYKCYLNQD